MEGFSEKGMTNLLALQRALSAFEDRDLTALFRDPAGAERVRAALSEIAAPDLVTVMVGTETFKGTFEGPDGFIEGWRDFLDTFASFHNEITGFVEADPDTILVVTRQRGTTAHGGVELDNRAAALFRFEGRRLIRAEFHLDPVAAERAAGLEPGRLSQA